MAETEKRTTRQRTAIIDALTATNDFVSAQALHARMRDGGQPIGLATVYRTLGALVAEGTADSLREPEGETLYRLCSTDGHHHHLVCRTCGKAVEIQAPQDEEWADELGRKHGFTDIDHTLEIFGTCAACRA